ncbi:MAG: prepilin-type N-terminal cleavage/methylation domain-containing protein [Cyanobacteria bacterium]|nr:prepilin-type N-terminal cleavage/methylation domain-containing protein [Cyanobacteriota bacterium]
MSLKSLDSHKLRFLSKGFTLIELAIVVSLIATLAAVVVPKFGDVDKSAEAAAIRNMACNLNSAKTIYTLKTGNTATSFADFVSSASVPGGTQTIGTGDFGPKHATSPCSVNSTLISCYGTFKRYNYLQYFWQDGEIITIAQEVSAAQQQQQQQQPQNQQNQAAAQAAQQAAQRQFQCG